MHKGKKAGGRTKSDSSGSVLFAPTSAVFCLFVCFSYVVAAVSVVVYQRQDDVEIVWT